MDGWRKGELIPFLNPGPALRRFTLAIRNTCYITVAAHIGCKQFEPLLLRRRIPARGFPTLHN